MNVYRLHRGDVPLLVSLPHVGTEIPADLRANFTERALATEDTDWHLDCLYDFVTDLGASLLVPRYSRYVIDLNRPADNQPMYAGANNTELCPTRFFTGEPLYREGRAPDAAEIERRVVAYWRPYHDALAGELTRLQALHGHVVLFDGHSIRSQLPWLFDGTLPHLNLGTASGTSCARDLADELVRVCAASPQYQHVMDGRFRGGYITRHYGAPAQGRHAVQLEMAWRTYMDEATPALWQPERATVVRPLLQSLVRSMIDWRPDVG
jgi:N-formylglutamate deformylase